MEVSKGLAGFGQQEVRYDAAPDLVIAGLRVESLINRRRRVCKTVLPEIDMKMFGAQLRQHCRWVRELLVPNVSAGVGVRLPARFEPDHIYRHVAGTELASQVERLLLVEVAFSAIPDSEAPTRRKRTAAGEQIVSLYGEAHSGPTKDVNV